MVLGYLFGRRSQLLQSQIFTNSLCPIYNFISANQIFKKNMKILPATHSECNYQLLLDIYWYTNMEAVALQHLLATPIFLHLSLQTTNCSSYI